MAMLTLHRLSLCAAVAALACNLNLSKDDGGSGASGGSDGTADAERVTITVGDHADSLDIRAP